MAKQKVVLKLCMVDARQRAKAMRCAVGLLGVVSVSHKGDKMTVVGEGIDPVELTRLLRKKMGYVELLKVTTIEEEKEADINSTQQSPYHYGQHVGFVTQPTNYYVDVEQFNYEQTSCSIM